MDARFGVDASHILLAALGASLIVSYWLPHLLVRRPPAATGSLGQSLRLSLTVAD